MPRYGNIPTNMDDMIDSRDIIAALDDNTEIEEEDAGYEDIIALRAFADEAEGAEDWNHGALFIRDSAFQDYAEQFAEDIGAINHEASWPNTCIDWEQVARELRMDFTAYDFGGITYWAR
ncbi:MAG: hypothetical protein KGL39_37775 [Patescibacteria group bacterium]|nr:hypothetical protein [Patescibacteria group bacterium]